MSSLCVSLVGVAAVLAKVISATPVPAVTAADISVCVYLTSGSTVDGPYVSYLCEDAQGEPQCQTTYLRECFAQANGDLVLKDGADVDDEGLEGLSCRYTPEDTTIECQLPESGEEAEPITVDLKRYLRNTPSGRLRCGTRKAWTYMFPCTFLPNLEELLSDDPGVIDDELEEEEKEEDPVSDDTDVIDDELQKDEDEEEEEELDEVDILKSNLDYPASYEEEPTEAGDEIDPTMRLPPGSVLDWPNDGEKEALKPWHLDGGPIVDAEPPSEETVDEEEEAEDEIIRPHQLDSPSVISNKRRKLPIEHRDVKEEDHEPLAESETDKEERIKYAGQGFVPEFVRRPNRKDSTNANDFDE